MPKAFDPFELGSEEGIDVMYVQPGAKQSSPNFGGTPGTSLASSPDGSSAEVSPNPSYDNDGFLQRPDPMSNDARTTSDETGNTTGRLVKLVKEQVNMVQTLTNANQQNAAELERVRQEKLQMEEDYKRMQEELRRAKAAKETRETREAGMSRSGGGNRRSNKSLGSITEGNSGWSVGFSSDTKGLPPPPPKDDMSVMTPYTVDNEAGPGRGRGGAPSRGRNWSEDQSVCDTVGASTYASTVIFPSARTAEMAVPVRKSRSWRRKKGRGGGGDKQPPPKTKYNAPLPEPTGGDKESCESRLWASFAFVCTFFVPNFLICKSGPGAKQAWREKVAICVVAFLVSAFFVGLFGFIPLFFCTETDTYTFQDIWAKDREAWTVIHGNIYDMKEWVNVHPGGSDAILEWLGKDSSKMFPRTPPANLPEKCLNTDKDLSSFSRWECTDFTDLDELVNLRCHAEQAKARTGVDRWLGEYKAGTLAFAASSLANDRAFDWVVINDRVYNVTNYVNGLRNENSNLIQKDPDDSDNAYLHPTLHSLIVNKLNEDATAVYDKLFDSQDFIDCLDELFYVGIVDNRSDPACRALSIAMYVMLIFVAFILVLQCLCSLLYLARPAHAFTKEDGESPVMCMVPCYNEGDRELRKTINSVAETQYPDENKVMVVVADGSITGKGESKSTPEIIADILGFEINKHEDEAYEYKSIGALTENRANVYSGVYEKKGKSLKYIVIVKCGVDSEAGSGRAGNRGKRDSQLIITGMFNRIHHERELCPLDKKIVKAMNLLHIPAYETRYLMTIDADTRVHQDSMSHMVYQMNKNEKILALCGETRVDNKAQSIITMLQVFEYYTNHHMKKAFESVFGCVTCLPGCFTMYRIFSIDGRSLIAQDNVYSEYSRNDIESLHEKNLYYLGEDRMLTTLLLKNFPDMRLSFVPEAACWTIVPHTFWILLSQRRRWINSTFHNMWELLKVNTMCGICCFSMKTIVILDLIATMVLPASMLYAGYFIYLVFVTGEDISMLMLILYGVIFGVQIVIFLLRSRWDYLFWFTIFMVFGIPLFYFVLPLYSFAKMDDFSWGQTRQVSKQAPTAQPSPSSAPNKQDGQKSQVASRSQSRSHDVRYNQSTRAGERSRSSGERRPSTSRPVTVDRSRRPTEARRSASREPETYRASRSSSRAQGSSSRARSTSRDPGQDAEMRGRAQARKDAERRRRREAERSGHHSRQNSVDLGEC